MEAGSLQGPRTNLDGLVEAGSLMGVRLAIIILQILVIILFFDSIAILPVPYYYSHISHTTDLILDSDTLLSF